MTPAELTLIIGVLCNTNYSNGLIPKETKIACIESYANCAIGPNGVIDRKVFKACREKYKDGVFQGESK